MNSTAEGGYLADVVSLNFRALLSFGSRVGSICHHSVNSEWQNDGGQNDGNTESISQVGLSLLDTALKQYPTDLRNTRIA